MVKLALEIKNASRGIKPKKGDVVIFDGESWYITTKDDIYREYEQKVDAKLQEVDQKMQQMENFKNEISAQIIKMGEIIKNFVNLQGDK